MKKMAGSGAGSVSQRIRIRTKMSQIQLVFFMTDKVSGLMVGSGEGGGDRRVMWRGVAAQRVVMPRSVLYAHVPANLSQ